MPILKNILASPTIHALPTCFIFEALSLSFLVLGLVDNFEHISNLLMHCFYVMFFYVVLSLFFSPICEASNV